MTVKATLSLRRKNRLNLLREGRKLRSFDEYPVLRPEVDPQVHASSNQVDQPFYLVCEKDTVIAQVRGASRILFRDESVNHFDTEPGDFVYVPGGAAHRVLTRTAGEMIRYKAQQPGTEAVLWSCENCGRELDHHVWDNRQVLAQTAYQAACERFNDDEDRRRCEACGTVHPPIDLAPFQWDRVAQTLAEADDE